MPRYLVLARREYTESLTYQGMLDAGDGQDPAHVVRERFGNEWLEVVLAPDHAVHWVLGPDSAPEAVA